MTDKYIYPTHSCFDDALELVAQLVLLYPEKEADLFIVHALCKAQGGEIYAHAWMEDDRKNMAVFTGIQDAERRHFAGVLLEYRAYLNVQEHQRYRWKEAYALNVLTGHQGPWETKFRVACGNSSRKIFNLPANAKGDDQ